MNRRDFIRGRGRLGRLCLQQELAEGDGDSLGAVGGAELREERVDVLFDGVDADAKLHGDVLVVEAADDRLEDILLASGQVGERRIVAEEPLDLRRDDLRSVGDGVDRRDERGEVRALQDRAPRAGLESAGDDVGAVRRSQQDDLRAGTGFQELGG